MQCEDDDGSCTSHATGCWTSCWDGHARQRPQVNVDVKLSFRVCLILSYTCRIITEFLKAILYMYRFLHLSLARFICYVICFWLAVGMYLIFFFPVILFSDTSSGNVWCQVICTCTYTNTSYTKGVVFEYKIASNYGLVFWKT